MFKKINWYAIARRKGAFLERDVFIRYLCLKKATMLNPDYNFSISRYKYIDWEHYYDKEEFLRLSQGLVKKALRIGNFDKFYSFRLAQDKSNKKVIDQINNDLGVSDEVIIDYFKKYVEIRGTTICALLAGNYLVRGFSNYVEKELIEYLKDIPENEVKKILIELSFSEKESVFYRREKEILNLAVELKKTNCLNFEEVPESMKAKIGEFRKKYEWSNSMFLFRKEVNTEDIFEELLDALKNNPEDKLKEMAEERVISLKKKKELIKEYNLNQEIIKALDLLAETSYLETELVRLFQLTDYYGYPLLSEIGRRFGLSYDEVIYLGIQEIIDGLKGNSIPDKSILAERDHMFGFYFESDINTFESFWGDQKMNKYRETKIDPNLKEIKGTVASRGKTTGRVRVILETSRVNEMQDGEILVTMMTTPSFVTAMKKAAAVVTSDGGITCHAAIISRELGIPCVIGTKIATQVLKTGDRVEVDAENGIVKIL